MDEYAWSPFPYSNDDYHYAVEALPTHWDQLHLGDKEPYPGAAYLEKLCEAYPEAKDSVPNFNGEYGDLADKLQQAWRYYHQGEFQQAVERGLSLGISGYCVANKAMAHYANYLEEDETKKRALFDEVVQRAEQARAIMPEHANSHYLYAYALGRYSQSISVLKALAQGFGGKIKSSLDRTLELQPEHAEAHTATGTYHAEVIDKMGSLVGGLTYGAKKELSLEHFQKAIELTPEAATARIEYAEGLLLLYGDKKLNEATQLYVEASEIKPLEATARLDVELAKSQLE